MNYILPEQGIRRYGDVIPSDLEQLRRNLLGESREGVSTDKSGRDKGEAAQT